MDIFAIPKGPEPLAQGSLIFNLGSGFHEYYNHEFCSSSLVVDENIFLV